MADLVQRALKGDSEAVDPLFRLVLPSLRITIRTLVPRDLLRLWDVDDLCQFVCIHVLQSLPTMEYQGVGPFRAWLRSVAHTRILNLWHHERTRARDSRRTRLLDDLPRPEEPVAGEDEVPLQAARREEQALVVEAVRRLSARQAELVRLIHLEQVPVAQAAAFLGISESSAREHLARGLARLARVLGPSLGEGAAPPGQQAE